MIADCFCWRCIWSGTDQIHAYLYYTILLYQIYTKVCFLIFILLPHNAVSDYPKVMKQLFLGAILTAITALLSTLASAESNEVFFKDCGYRCKPYESCKVGKDKMACYYGSGGCCSGGITFKNGKDFSIEWIMEYFDQEGRSKVLKRSLKVCLKQWPKMT